MKLSQFIGQNDAKLGLILNAIDPRCGGLLLVGGKGSGKSTIVRISRGILPEGVPFVELPLNVTEDSLLGGVDIEQTMREGRRTLQAGIISRADNGVIFVDDINLLSQELLALVMEPHGRGEEIIEREGLTERRKSSFCILAAMNPAEGELSPHLMDRIGLCAIMQDLQAKDERLAVLRLTGSAPFFTVEQDIDVSKNIMAAKTLLPAVQVSSEMLEHLGEVVQRNLSPGHRGDLFLFYAARAFAALQNSIQVERQHIDRVSNLVFAHRRLQLREEEHPPRQQQQQAGNNQDQQHDNQENQQQSGAEQNNTSGQSSGEADQKSGVTRQESSSREEIMQVGTPFKLRRLSFRKDRQKRHANGRRTKTRTNGRSGRYVKSMLTSADRDIAIDATLRASAPYQKMRGREGMLIIEPDDLRFRQRERKMGHLVLFVVDGSGSMGARKRMVETKGAIQALLMDCYQKRDKVAMIVFRKDHAELVLPPTASVELAAKQLAALPVGGKTPLAAGLLETSRLIRQVGMRNPETRFLVILITDGRGNQAISESSSRNQEIASLTQLLSEEQRCDFIVIDTESKDNFLKTDLALELAKDLEADYYTTEALQAEYLTEIIQAKNANVVKQEYA